MANGHYRTAGAWILVADAGPAYTTGSRFAPQIAAFRIHHDSTATAPEAEGAVHVGETGINKAEYLAVLSGLRLLADRMATGDWNADPVHVVTDNLFVVKQAVHEWEANELGGHLTRLEDVCAEVSDMIQGPIYFVHAANGESKGADALARNFRNSCDQQQRDRWALFRLRERWLSLLDHLRDKREMVLAASLATAWVSAYNGKSMTIEFPYRQAAQEEKVEQRMPALKAAMTSVLGISPKQVRCVLRAKQ